MKKLLTIGVLTLATIGLSGCGNNKNDMEINIGYFNNVTHAQALVMKAEKTLETELGEGVSVNWTAFNAGPAEVEALFAEDIDIGYIGPVPAVSANTKSNGDVVILTGATKGGAVMVKRAGTEINDVKDLDGKTVAIPQIGNTQHLSLLHLLDENELEPVTDGGTVNITAVANADVANMMDRGDIDAALVPEPWGATLEEKGAEIVLNYDEIYMQGQYDVAVVVVRKEFMEEHPDYVEAFLKAHEAVTVKIVEEQEKCLQIMNAELQSATGKSLSDSIIKKAFERIVVDTALNKPSIMGFAEISEDEEFIDEEPKEANLFGK
ncbi:MAG: aliphatic sulfonate ABC transporter substrate-binding protein [Lachnospiraceae bacterium]|nr:aliphatic sulfonate ABC transporter substrate-binding protein [Lachnospiraceae bacterium]